jgi:hypothetical protein
MQFLRNLILDGQWKDAEGFIKTIFDSVNFDQEENREKSIEL